MKDVDDFVRDQAAEKETSRADRFTQTIHAQWGFTVKAPVLDPYAKVQVAHIEMPPATLKVTDLQSPPKETK